LEGFEKSKEKLVPRIETCSLSLLLTTTKINVSRQQGERRIENY